MRIVTSINIGGRMTVFMVDHGLDPRLDDETEVVHDRNHILSVPWAYRKDTNEREII